jgi:hypothetical protein
MKKLLTIGFIVLVMLVSTSISAIAFPRESELDKISDKIEAIRTDLIKISKSVSDNHNKEVALNLVDKTELYNSRILYIKKKLIVLRLLRTNDVRESVTIRINDYVNITKELIDLDIDDSIIDVAPASNNAIISLGNNLKIELRKLKELLSH